MLLILDFDVDHILTANRIDDEHSDDEHWFSDESEGILGLNENAVFENCESAKGNEVLSILTYAERIGMSTGIVTDTRVTHATPAAFYSHTPSRNWETIRRRKGIVRIYIPVRNNPILGFQKTIPPDGKPALTLAYSDGPGGLKPNTERANLTGVNYNATGFNQQAFMWTYSESHGGEDV
ncbi:alkaline phosphatase, partial [Paramuricea clavata]